MMKARTLGELSWLASRQSMLLALSVPVTYLIITRTLSSFRSSVPPSLRDVWNSAAEVVKHAYDDGRDAWIVPVGQADQLSGLAPPPMFAKHTVFALTAFDPPGVTRTLEENTQANEQMWGQLQQEFSRSAVTPVAAHRSFGFDLAEGWREDGFCVVVDNTDSTRAREIVLRVAAQFRQGAIFQYYPTSHSATPTLLKRATVPVQLQGDEVSYTTLQFVPPITNKDNTLLTRAWAGPQKLLQF